METAGRPPMHLPHAPAQHLHAEYVASRLAGTSAPAEAPQPLPRPASSRSGSPGRGSALPQLGGLWLNASSDQPCPLLQRTCHGSQSPRSDAGTPLILLDFPVAPAATAGARAAAECHTCGPACQGWEPRCARPTAGPCLPPSPLLHECSPMPAESPPVGCSALARHPPARKGRQRKPPPCGGRLAADPEYAAGN